MFAGPRLLPVLGERRVENGITGTIVDADCEKDRVRVATHEREPIPDVHPGPALNHEVIVGQSTYGNTGEPLAVNALRLDIDSGRTRSLALGSPRFSREWFFDPQGEPRVIVAVPTAIGSNGALARKKCPVKHQMNSLARSNHRHRVWLGNQTQSIAEGSGGIDHNLGSSTKFIVRFHIARDDANAVPLQKLLREDFAAFELCGLSRWRDDRPTLRAKCIRDSLNQRQFRSNHR